MPDIQFDELKKFLEKIIFDDKNLIDLKSKLDMLDIHREKKQEIKKFIVLSREEILKNLIPVISFYLDRFKIINHYPKDLDITAQLMEEKKIQELENKLKEREDLLVEIAQELSEIRTKMS
ncbi:MAG: hypothetical protein ACTSUX_15285 [Promethearchaeota archaeon]